MSREVKESEHKANNRPRDESVISVDRNFKVLRFDNGICLPPKAAAVESSTSFVIDFSF